MRLSGEITVLLALFVAHASCTTTVYYGNTTVCSCASVARALNTASTFCPQDTYQGTCNREMLMYDDEACRIFCKPDPRIHGFVRSGSTTMDFEYLACNPNSTMVNEAGVTATYKFALCLVEASASSCADLPFASSCPDNYNCGNELRRSDNDRDISTYTCNKGFLTAVDSTGAFSWISTPYCSTNATWSNTTLYPTQTGFYAYKNISLTCSKPKGCVQCTALEAIPDDEVDADFLADNDVDATKLVLTNDPLDGSQAACTGGYRIAAFSTSDPSNAALNFTRDTIMQCSASSVWLNNNINEMPSDVRVTCARAKATCGCDYTPNTASSCGCDSSVLAPTATSAQCELECPLGYFILATVGGRGRYLNSFSCSSAQWSGSFSFSDYAANVSAVTGSPVTSCIPNPLIDAPDFNYFDGESCQFEGLFFLNGRLGCNGGLYLVAFGSSSSTTPTFIASATPVATAWKVITVTGEQVIFGAPYFACWTGTPPPEVDVLVDDADDEDCAGCSWSYFKGNKADQSCVNGVLTVSYEPGTVCQTTVIKNATSLQCSAGTWTFLNGTKTSDVDCTIPINRCEGPVPEPSTTANPDSGTSGTTSRPTRECHSNDTTCGGCPWFQYSDDEDLSEVCSSGYLKVWASASVTGDVCSLEGEAAAGGEAFFCLNGNWWFVSAGANVSIEVTESNPFFDCAGDSTATPVTDNGSSHSTVETSDATTSRHTRECHSNDTTCGGCPWFQYSDDDDLSEVCSSGYLKVWASASVTGDVCSLEGAAAAGGEAFFCLNGNWWFVSAGANVSIEVTESNPFFDCAGDSTATPFTGSSESSSSIASSTSPDLCTEAPACSCSGGDFPVVNECDSGSTLLTCGDEGDIFVSVNGVFTRYSAVRFLGSDLWMAYVCGGTSILIEGELTARCRLSTETPTA